MPIDIAMVPIVRRRWDAPDETTMLKQLRRQIDLMPTITEGWCDRVGLEATDLTAVGLGSA